MAHSICAETQTPRQRSNELMLKQCHAHGHVYSLHFMIVQSKTSWETALVGQGLCEHNAVQHTCVLKGHQDGRKLQGNTQHKQTCHFPCCQQQSPFSSAPSSLFALPWTFLLRPLPHVCPCCCASTGKGRPNRCLKCMFGSMGYLES